MILGYEVKNTAIFDLDRTLIECDLPITVLNCFYKNNPKSYKLLKIAGILIAKIPSHRVRRVFEYFEIFFLSKSVLQELIPEILTKNLKKELLDILIKYKEKGFKVYIVTAGPEKILKPVAEFFNVELIGSSVIAGIITNDIQGKKEIVYKSLLDNGMKIIAIYSDQEYDLSYLSEENYLVIDNFITKYK